MNSSTEVAPSIGSTLKTAFATIREKSHAYLTRMEQVVDQSIHHPVETVMANEPWLLFSICFSTITTVSLYLSSKSRASNELFFDKACLILWVSCAICIVLSVGYTNSATVGFVWMSTYLTEMTLSMENMLAYHAVFSLHRVPTPSRPKGLVWGIGLAMFVRFVFLVVGGAFLYGSNTARLVISGVLIIAGLFGVFTMIDASQQRRAKAYQIASSVCSFSERLVPSRWWEWLSVRDPDEDISTVPILVPGQSKWAVGIPIFVTVLSIELCDSFLTIWNTFTVLAQTSSLFIAYSSTAFALMTVRSIYLVAVAARPSVEPRLMHANLAGGLLTAAVGLQLLLSYNQGISTSPSLVLSGVVSTIALGFLGSNLYHRNPA